MRAVLALLLVACGDAEPSGPSEPAVVRAPATGWTRAERDTLARMRLDTTLPADPTNRWADHAEAAALGRTLFYDAGLSPSGTFSCASCHDPDKHFTDGLPKAVAAGTAERHTPTIEGGQHGPWFFWDGRADSLWAQAQGPLEAAVEMDSDRVFVVRAVRERHLEGYEALFGPMPDLGALPERARPGDADADPLAAAWDALSDAQRHAVTGVFVNVLKAIAAFERTVLPTEAPFDRYVDAVLAGDADGGGHLSDEAVDGLRLFLRDGNCVSCHHGPMLTDQAFHTLGLPVATGWDPGRTVGAERVLSHELNCRSAWSDAEACEELRFLNPTFQDFQAAFKTPTLRNVTATAPYMHDGSMASLDDVLEFYSTLPGEPIVGHRELTLQPLGLDPEQREALKAFLASLEAPVRPEALPPTDG